MTKKSRLGCRFSLAMLGIYYGFILVLAFSPATLGTPIGIGVITLGIPVGLAIVFTAFILTGIYVYQANNQLDPLKEKPVKECQA